MDRSLRADITAELAEHGSPSDPNYAAFYHPGTALQSGPWADARDRWLATQSNAKGMKEWIETSDDPEARTARVPLGETPALADTLAGWQLDTFSQIRDAAANNLQVDPSLEVFHYGEMANQMMGEVQKGPVAMRLFRSIAVDTATAERFRSMARDQTLDMNLSSWSQDYQIALSQGYEYVQGTLSRLVTFEANDSHGIPLGKYISDASDEWVTDGRFRILGVEEDGDSIIVRMEQQAPFSAPAQFKGLK